MLVLLLAWCLEAGAVGLEEGGGEEELFEGAGDFVVVVGVEDLEVFALDFDFDGVVSTWDFVAADVLWGFEGVATTWDFPDVNTVDVLDVLGTVAVLKDGYFGWVLWD